MENNNSGFLWNEGYSVKSKKFDGHHKKLFELINSLDKIIKTHGNSDELKEVKNELLNYTEYHFKEEEEMLKEFGAPDFFEHKTQHRFFESKIKDLIVQSEHLNHISVSFAAIKFLFDWLLNHILVTDKKYSRFFE